jgi:hypothetical protein
MSLTNYILASIPLILPGYMLIYLLDNPIPVIERWLKWILSASINRKQQQGGDGIVTPLVPPVSSQLLAYLVMGIFGFVATNRLVPHIKVSGLLDDHNKR